MSAEVTNPFDVAAQLLRERYSGAQVIFLAGSVVKEQATPSSDLDLIVVFEKLPNAYRESFRSHGWPVEVFVHDLETLKYFFFDDTRTHNPVTLRMVAEGVEVPGATPLSQSLKQIARRVLDAGPPALSEEEDARLRYMITNIVNDIRHPRSGDELVAAGALLYEKLSAYYFRTKGLWSNSGKLLPRTLHEADAAFATEFCAAFDELFAGRAERALRLTEELLAPRGGLLFEGYRYDAPAGWRIPIAGKG